MAPTRRYLRISKHSVLECRIFLENPADGPRWLLNPSDPALPRIFESIRPLVLPKLREENERAKGKGKKKKSVKDVVVRDEFEVSVFLTDVSTRHALLVKQKTFKGKPSYEDNTENRDNPIQIREESDDENEALNNIPDVNDQQDEDDAEVTGSRWKDGDEFTNENFDADDKKSLAFNTTYDGFAIWGKVLCLLVERKGGPGKKTTNSTDGGAQALMQEWITASQQQAEEDS